MVAFGIVRKRSTIAVNNGSSVGGGCGSEGSCRISLTSAWAMKKSRLALSSTTTRTSGSSAASRPNRSISTMRAASKRLIGGWSMVARAMPSSTRTRSVV
jgi:hypothetical protein